LFITFEGIDGAGKTTQLQRLKARLERLGKRVVATREPGGTPLGERLRSLLLDPHQHPPAAATEVLLYAASRAQLVTEVIRPALAEGAIVLCDRFVDASLAYQGAGLEVGVETVRAVNHFATGGLRPDCTFLFDLPIEVSRQRLLEARGKAAVDRIEQRDTAYFERVRLAFLELAKADPKRIQVLDATRSVVELEQEIWGRIANEIVL
jgi:dTMP kinase